ncbi:MAG: hypothetical protein AAFQ84_08695 [Pseudomonadota bacterium]
MTKAAFEHTRKLYQGAAFTAPWSDGLAARAGVAASLEIVRLAAGKTFDEDMRGEDLDAALSFLGSQGAPEFAVQRFREGLDIQPPEIRFEAVGQALRLIERAFGA